MTASIANNIHPFKSIFPILSWCPCNCHANIWRLLRHHVLCYGVNVIANDTHDVFERYSADLTSNAVSIRCCIVVELEGRRTSPLCRCCLLLLCTGGHAYYLLVFMNIVVTRNTDRRPSYRAMSRDDATHTFSNDVWWTEHLPRAPKTLSVGNFPNFEGVDGTIGDTDATFPPWRCWDGPVCGRGSCYCVRSQDPNLNFGGSFFMSKRYWMSLRYLSCMLQSDHCFFKKAKEGTLPFCTVVSGKYTLRASGYRTLRSTEYSIRI